MIKSTLSEVQAGLELTYVKLKVTVREAFEIAEKLGPILGEGWDIYVATAYMTTLRIVAAKDMTLDEFRMAQKMLESAIGQKFKRSGTGADEGKVSLEADAWKESLNCEDFIYICLRSSRTIGCKLRWEQEIRNVPILDPGCLDGVSEHEPEIRSELPASESERGAEETLGDAEAGEEAAGVGAAGDQVSDGDRDPDSEGASAVDVDSEEPL